MIMITIKTDNAAFQDGNRATEIASILHRMAEQVTRNATISPRDSNGNTVGKVTLTGKDRVL